MRHRIPSTSATLEMIPKQKTAPRLKVIMLLKTMAMESAFVGVSKPGGSLDRRVNCRRVPQPRWVDARRNAKGERKQSEGGRRERADPATFV
jgi:hypothetical protein